MLKVNLAWSIEIGQIYYALGLVLKKVFKVYLKEIKPL